MARWFAIFLFALPPPVMAVQPFLNEHEAGWYWHKDEIEKAKKQKRDILSELAEKVVEDIAKKENLLDELKKKYGR